MVIDYDHNPSLITDQKLQSLSESVQRAIDEMTTSQTVVTGEAADAVSRSIVAHNVATSAQNSASAAQSAAQDAETYAGNALSASERAETYAGNALTAAQNAQTYAGNALTAAQNAEKSADAALVSLSNVEDVVGVLEWITAHGTMTPNGSTALDPAKVYFIVDNPNGDYVVGGTHYSIVSEPKAEDRTSYYTLSVDESVQNYIATHLSLTNDGLYVLADNSEWKVLVASDGVYILDTNSDPNTQMTSSGITVGRKPNPQSYDSEHLLWAFIDNTGFRIKQQTYLQPYREEEVGGISRSVQTSPASVADDVWKSVKTSWSHRLWYTPATGTNITVKFSPTGSVTFPVGTAYTDAGNRFYYDGNRTIRCSGVASATATVTFIKYSTTQTVGGSYIFIGGHEDEFLHGNNSAMFGNGLVAQMTNQFVIGEYNLNSPDHALEIGNGSGISANGMDRSNALTVDWNGNVVPAGQIKTSFKSSIAMGSYQAVATTVPNLVDEVRYSSGCAGSVSIGTNYTANSVTITAGWYNFMYMPHRSGGVNGSASGDNCNYGNLLLFGMNNTYGRFVVRVSSGAIAEVCKLLTSLDRYTRSSAGGLDWTNNTEGDTKVIMKSALAFWNGSYNGTTSNLSRCVSGAIIGDNTSIGKTTWTPTSGSSYSNYGGCYYEKYGRVVHVHVGVSGLTANTATVIYTLPSGYRPSSTVFAHGTGGAWNNIGYVEIYSDGRISARSQGTYCGADITFLA